MNFDKSFIDEIRGRVPISEVIAPRVAWDKKKTRPNAGDWWAPCPFHGEKSASFHVVDKKGFFHCFGCGKAGDHFKFLTELDGLTFPRAVEEVARMAGVSMPSSAPLTEDEKRERARRARERDEAQRRADAQHAKQQERRVKSAGAIWKETVPLAGTPGQAYFEWRGMRFLDDENIRFHPAIEHKDAPGLFPAVVARVQGPDGKGIGIWRIYLQPNGEGKASLPEGASAKMGFGPTAGGAVRLGGIANHIGLCEGVETGRAIRELGVSYPVWPALSTSGIIGFQIPPGVERVTVYPDPDGSKLKRKLDRDGQPLDELRHPPGKEALRIFIENNPGRDIRAAETAFDADYLEVLQNMKGVPIR